MTPIKGQAVMIYQDPITKKKPEDEARLVKFLGRIGKWEGRYLECWRVRFADGLITERTILA